MNVISYFEPLNEPMFKDEAKLVDLWKANWAENGWNPVVTGPAGSDRKWDGWLDEVRDFPCVNPHEYEMACWRRWCVFAEAAEELCGTGTALIVDYDTFNLNTHPSVFQHSVPVCNHGEHDLPWALIVSAASLRAMPQMLMAAAPSAVEQINGRPHVSDMLAMKKLMEEGFIQQALPVRIAFDAALNPGTHFGLVHLANSVVGPRGKTKLEAWKMLEER